MDGGDTLTEMASCDFSAPLSVTIIYDDSDDEVQTEKKYILQERSMPNNYQENDFKDRNNDRFENVNYPKKRKLDNTIKNKNQNEKLNQSSECSIKKLDAETTKTVFEVENKLSKESDIQEITKSKSFDELDKFLNGLLVKVSESLIHILDAYHAHLRNVLNRTNDVPFVQESKKRYFRIRNHFFQLCYCTTVTVILSRENDAKFTEDFLKHTVTLADQKKNLTVTEEQIKPFYYQMILWTKQRSEFQNLPLNPTVYNTTKNSEPLLRRQLSLPPQLPSFQSSLINSRPHTVCQNTDADEREIKITALNDQHQPVLLYRKILSPVASQQTGPNMTNILRGQRIPIQHNANRMEDNYRPVAQNMAPTSNFVPANTLMDRNHLYRPYAAYRDIHNLIDGRFLPTYDRTLQLQQHSMVSGYSESVKDSVQMNQNCTIDSSRSSVSTDSGFTSPHSHSPVDSTVIQETSNAYVTPLITHITSLNPKALQMDEGSCYICGAPTKKKCVGCYQIYYCSYECQKSDWSRHMMFCVQVSKNHKN